MVPNPSSAMVPNPSSLWMDTYHGESGAEEKPVDGLSALAEKVLEEGPYSATYSSFMSAAKRLHVCST